MSSEPNTLSGAGDRCGRRTGRQLGAIPFENCHRRRLSVLGEGPEISEAVVPVSGHRDHAAGHRTASASARSAAATFRSLRLQLVELSSIRSSAVTVVGVEVVHSWTMSRLIDQQLHYENGAPLVSGICKETRLLPQSPFVG